MGGSDGRRDGDDKPFSRGRYNLVFNWNILKILSLIETQEFACSEGPGSVPTLEYTPSVWVEMTGGVGKWVLG